MYKYELIFTYQIILEINFILRRTVLFAVFINQYLDTYDAIKCLHEIIGEHDLYLYGENYVAYELYVQVVILVYFYF